MGSNFGLGHGAVDFAGSGVVHMVGGVTALAGAIVLGPRIGKYKKDGTPNAIPGHHIPMGIAGALILAFGWFGFNPGSTLAGTDLRIGVIAVNTMLASAGGALSAMLYMWLRFGKPDPTMTVNGLLAGLVAITAPCAFVTAPSAVLIGLIAGVLVVLSVLFIDGVLKVDDPVGAISVHGVCGAWGVLSLGLFADGTYGDKWNSVEGTVKGLFYGDASQFAGPGHRCGGQLHLCFLRGLGHLQAHRVSHRQPGLCRDGDWAAWMSRKPGSWPTPTLSSPRASGKKRPMAELGDNQGNPGQPAIMTTGEYCMKKIEAIIQPFRLEPVKEALHAISVQGMTVSRSQGLRGAKRHPGGLPGHGIPGGFPAQGEDRDRGDG